MTVLDPTLPSLAGTGVIVTGASGGVGRGIARRFAAAGAAVLVHYHRSAAPAESLVSELTAAGHTALAAQADVRDPAECRALIRAAVSAFGGVSAVVNNAGVQPVGALQDLSVDEWRTVVDTNLTGVFVMTQAAAEHFRTVGGGSITHIASVEASRPAPAHAHYSAAKAGIVMHARAAALELGADGIRVNTVSPGLIDAGGLAENWPSGHASWLAHAPLARTGSPEDIGNACVFLASAGASFITGHDLVVDGGMLATPGW